MLFWHPCFFWTLSKMDVIRLCCVSIKPSCSKDYQFLSANRITCCRFQKSGPNCLESCILWKLWSFQSLKKIGLISAYFEHRLTLCVPEVTISKQCQDQLTPVLTTIVNASLSCAEFPTELKKAFLTPLIKKIILDCEIFKNYRPVSNLSFISKLVERVVCVQLVEHLKSNNLYEIFQSAYRQLHSTETALLRVQNDLLQAVDNEGGAILVLLDLSAAFDTIDHQKLLNLLNQSFGIRGVALK